MQSQPETLTGHAGEEHPHGTIPREYHLKILAQGGRRAELEAPSQTTVGSLKMTALHALQIQPDPNVSWFLHYRGEQLNDEQATLAHVIGPVGNPHEEVVLHLKKQPFAGASNAPDSSAPEPTRSYIEAAVDELRQRTRELAIAATAVEGVNVFVTVLARAIGGARERYTVRFRCDGYNGTPPSVTMVDPITREPAANAWPNVPDGPGAIFRPNAGSLEHAFICTPGTREWFSHGHGEFRSPEYWTLASIVEAIHFGLHSTGYRGRWPA